MPSCAPWLIVTLLEAAVLAAVAKVAATATATTAATSLVQSADVGRTPRCQLLLLLLLETPLRRPQHLALHAHTSNSECWVHVRKIPQALLMQAYTPLNLTRVLYCATKPPTCT